MRRRLTPDERERQLPLPLPVPLYEVEPQQLRIDGPLPEAIRIEKDGRRSGLLHATGDASPEGKAWTAVLRAQGEIAWECRHVHRNAAGALECAWQARGIILARALPVPPAKEG
jgi:hypothetical protein